MIVYSRILVIELKPLKIWIQFDYEQLLKRFIISTLNLMKKISLAFFILWSLNSFAQQGDEKPEKEKGFKKEKLFTGGSANAGFSSYSTILGITPQFGYSLTNWADAGNYI